MAPRCTSRPTGSARAAHPAATTCSPTTATRPRAPSRSPPTRRESGARPPSRCRPTARAPTRLRSSITRWRIFSRDTTTGVLTPAGVLHDGAGGVDGLNAATSLVVSGDGADVYVSAGGVDSSVATFARNSSTSALTYQGIVHQDLGGANDVAISSDDANVYAVSYDSRAPGQPRPRSGDRRAHVRRLEQEHRPWRRRIERSVGTLTLAQTPKTSTSRLSAATPSRRSSAIRRRLRRH